MFRIPKAVASLSKKVRPLVILHSPNRHYVCSISSVQLYNKNLNGNNEAIKLRQSEQVAGLIFTTNYSSDSGCCPGDDIPDPTTGLTKREIKVIKSTWSLVMKDAKSNGVALLALWLKEHPEYIKYFPFKKVPPQDFPKTPKFQAHAVNIMYALHAIIDNLHKPELVMHLLNKNGESHGRRNIPEKSYWDIKKATLKVLSKGLGKHFTKEARAAWDKLLTTAIKVISKNLAKYKAQKC